MAVDVVMFDAVVPNVIAPNMQELQAASTRLLNLTLSPVIQSLPWPNYGYSEEGLLQQAEEIYGKFSADVSIRPRLVALPASAEPKYIALVLWIRLGIHTIMPIYEGPIGFPTFEGYYLVPPVGGEKEKI